ncbi:hypothetical protein EGW08_004718, partial [Elysia chlorotica]
MYNRALPPTHLRDVDSGQILDHLGQFLHDAHHLIGQFEGADVTLPAGHHGHLPGIGQGGGDFSGNLGGDKHNTLGLQHHVHHSCVLVVLPGVCFLGHLLSLGLGPGLNSEGLSLSLQL